MDTKILMWAIQYLQQDCSLDATGDWWNFPQLQLPARFHFPTGIADVLHGKFPAAFTFLAGRSRTTRCPKRATHSTQLPLSISSYRRMTASSE